MSKINILDSIIFNRIAAGEVVESPSSVVKELIENSIDAGANSITVEIKDGGIDYIRVTDNGKGMEAVDIPIAFMPHATSKIKTLDDLEKIGTLGFRGEALPSIASVARVSITSRPADCELGHCVVFENGLQTFESSMGAPWGTTVTVEGLFDKIPARKKFLKKPTLEGARITELIQKLILANHSVSFKYINNGEIIFHSSGNGIDEAIYTIYGDTIKNLNYIESTMPDITLKGYINKPTFSKHNKSYQTLIVNGRVVENEDISFYIYICYQDYLMRRQYPMFILYIDLPFDMIDVNVHPNKMNVKFSDLPRVKNIIMSAVKASITRELNIPKIIEFKSQSHDKTISDIFEDNPKNDALNKNDDNSKNNIDTVDFKRQNDIIEKTGIRITSDFLTKDYTNTDSALRAQSVHAQCNVFRETAGTAEQKFNSQNSGIPFLKMESMLSKNSTLDITGLEQCALTKEHSYVICGKLFNTYILVQENDYIYLVDQHAAHEKILYDKLIESIDTDCLSVQNLLIPFIFEVNSTEKQQLLEKMEELNTLGFGITEFGENVFALHSIPILCMDINLKEFTASLIDTLRCGRIKKSDFIKEAVMQSACKSAVKAHDDLNKDEITVLIDNMIENGGALFCPHGRPIVIKLTKMEIEKWFKRIV